MTHEERLDRLQALLLVQSADTSALLHLVETTGLKLGLPPQESAHLREQFLRVRRQLLHLQLETLEQTDPGLAARLQSLIDTASTIYPPTYE